MAHACYGSGVVAQAHAWAEELFSGKVSSLAQMAKRNGVSEGYLKKIMPLAFLAPDIVTSILAGNQPAGLSKQKMVGDELPLTWLEQRQVFGFDTIQN